MPCIMSDLSFYGQQCDDYVRQEFFPAKSILVDGSNGIASVAFDGEDEFLWTGGHSGLISSFYGLNSEPYSSFQAHDASEVRFLLPLDQRIVSIASDTVACSSKLGQPLYYHKSRSASDLQCAVLSPANLLYLGGLSSSIIELDIERRTEVRLAEIGNAGNVILRFSSSYLCSGSTSGVVSLLDPNSLKLVRTLEAHNGSLSDFDVCGHQLITCGFSLKNSGQQVIDRHLMMFDLRYCKAMAPMQMLIDPMFLRFVQTYSNQICVVSQNGKFQVLEQGCSGYQSPVYEVPMLGSHLTSCAVSSSSMVLAFGESTGYVHTFTGNHENPVFNHYLPDTEFAAAEQEQLTGFGSSLSTGSSYYPEPSTWASPVNQATYRNPADIGSPLYHSMMRQGQSDVIYPGNPMKLTEGDDPYKLPQSHSKIKPNSLSLAGCQSDQVSGGDDQSFVIPKCYRKVEIKYSKYGVDGFDFRSYNKTNFAGLETHIPNAYCNAMIQVLYFLEPLRNTLMNHLCEREFCLSCELGFLFHMLQQQTTRTCQATNFLRAFRTIPQVTALGLLLSDSDEVLGKVDLARLIQNWNRFILQQIDSELARQASNKLHRNVEQELPALSGLSFRSNSPDFDNTHGPSDVVQIQDLINEKLEISPNELDNGLCVAVDSVTRQPPEERNQSIVKQLFAYNVSTLLSCKVCSQSLERNTSLLIVDLLYPESVEPGTKVAKVPFSKVVERSLNDERRTRSWCSACSKYQIHLQHKGLNSVPDVLSLHCHLESSADFAFWKAQDQNAPKVNGDIGTTHPANTKLCRYGVACTRPDCRFRHDKPKSSLSQSDNSVVTSARGAWVPFGLKLLLKPDGKVKSIEDEGVSEPGAVCYELVASVACIKGGKSGGGNHLVSHVMVDKGTGKGPSGGQWYLFNDFAISPIDKNLAVNFDMDWKHPCLLYFAKVDINKKYNIPVADPIAPDVLFAHNSLITPRISDMKFVPLNKYELPQEGDIIGLDAEFVKLKPEKAELHSDGTKSTIKPSQMSVARVTCIREKDPLRGVPFIDDYIATQEEVVDYLTEFSGIQPGDLDPALSCRYLTTLKSTYLKLRYLINAKVIFVGHGLKKDFRVLNLVVPPEQVVDTVELFHLPKRRMISLKFLAWYFLGLKIQSSNHDSIEDSSAAIQLYYKYLELQAHGMDHVQDELERLYENGQQRNWRIPDDDEDLLYLGNTGLDLCLA